MANIRELRNRKGVTSYSVQVRLKGFPTQHSTFSKLTDAKKWIQEVESAIRDGRYFKTSEAKKHTFSEMIDRYIDQCVKDCQRYRKKKIAHLSWWKEQLGDYLLSDVTPSMIAAQRDTLLKQVTYRKTKRSPATVVRYLASLSHPFTVAFKEWGWIEESPMKKVTKPKESRGRVRFLSDEERMRLLEACEQSSSKYLYAVVVLAISTGMRRSEIMNLKWSDVDLSRGRIILHETKNGERRPVSLTGQALKTISDLDKVRRIDSQLIFPGVKRVKNPIVLRFHWELALKRAKIEDFRFHDLRHSCASYLAMNGASLSEISEVLGHKTLQMVKRYAHLSEMHTTGVVERMNQKIFG